MILCDDDIIQDDVSKLLGVSTRSLSIGGVVLGRALTRSRGSFRVKSSAQYEQAGEVQWYNCVVEGGWGTGWEVFPLA